MKRTTITMDGNGILSIPSNLEELWMSEGELVDILYVTAAQLREVILKRLYETKEKTTIVLQLNGGTNAFC